MLNFLPQENKNKIVREYILRVAIFLMLFVFIASIILISLFAPSFFFAKYKDDTVKTQLEMAKQKNSGKIQDPILFIKNVNRLSVALSDNSGPTASYSDIISKIVSLKNKDIKITSISISEDNATTNKRITIDGVANTRDSLTTYEKDLKVDGFFGNVIFPVSDYIKSTNSEFTATLIL